MALALSTQIALDERGVAWVVGANTKVKEIVLDRLAHGWSPEEMHFQHRHLSLAQIHAALAYYYEHQEQFDEEIERDLAHVDTLADAARPSELRARLSAITQRR